MPAIVTVGAANLDYLLRIRRFGRPGEEVHVDDVKTVPGGTAANVAVAAARLLNPDKVGIFCAIGDDENGKLLATDLANEGVDITLVQTIKRTPSGQAFILIDSQGENIIHSFPGATRKLRLGSTQLTTRNILIEAEIVVVMDPPLATARQIFQLRKNNRLFTLWEPGIFVSLEKARLLKLAGMVGMLILNEVETKTLFGSLNANQVQKQYSASLIVKKGSKGSALYQNGFVENFPAVPLKKIGLKASSTVGCGDAFIGAYIAFRLTGVSDPEAIHRANCAAAFKATRPETRGSHPREEFNRFFSKASKFFARR